MSWCPRCSGPSLRECVELEAPRDDEVAQILYRTLRQACADWGELQQAWPEDDFEVLQQQAIQVRLPLEVPPSRHRQAAGGRR